MAKLCQVDVFRCDSCGKETVANTEEVKTISKYCGMSEPMTLTDESIIKAEITPNKINTIQLPYIHREVTNVVSRGKEMDMTVGGPKGNVANEVRVEEFHVCEDCMNKIEEDFINFMNMSAEIQEKYFDTCFN